MTYAELNAWVDEKVNIQGIRLVIISLNGSNQASEDVFRKKLEEFSVTNGSDLLTVEQITL